VRFALIAAKALGMLIVCSAVGASATLFFARLLQVTIGLVGPLGLFCICLALIVSLAEYMHWTLPEQDVEQ
jgi:hypothetical protein